MRVSKLSMSFLVLVLVHPSSPPPFMNPYPMDELIVHKSSNVTDISKWMNFKINQGRRSWLTDVEDTLPKPEEVHFLTKKLRRGSCAVIGAASSLQNCSELNSACNHDVVIRVNDHKPHGWCTRTDIQVANQWIRCCSACDPNGIRGMPNCMPQRPGSVQVLRLQSQMALYNG